MSDHKIINSITSDGTGSISTVTISGVLKIEAAAELHQTLVEALAESQQVVLDAKLLEEMDMSILQAVCSACKTAAAGKKSFTFDGELPVCMATLNSGIGTYQGLSCRQNNDEACRWLGGVC
ncbi:MAG TPA: STAS domain-containing protein [Desulfuromonadaceae bacterium]|jgi:anti-anti-sigma regulatory factor